MAEPKDLKYEDVAMYKIKSKRVDFLIGEKKILSLTKKPFDKTIISFLKDFSKNLNQDKETNIYTDLRELSFWCRERNILRLQKKHSSDNYRIGKGLIFHITPSNVPTNFFYSLIFGLLSGNSNVIKISSNKFEQVRIIVNNLQKVLKGKKHNKVKKMITIIRYENEDDTTKYLSSICDLRVIWGGDKTIAEIRKFPIKTLANEICFADRFSFSIINTDKLSKNKNKIETDKLVNNFYNETMVMDQNACTTPHLILWKGRKNNEIIKEFWNKFSSKILQNYKFPELAMIDKYTQYCIDASQKKKIKKISVYNKHLFIADLKELNNELSSHKGMWGYFYQYKIKKLDQIAPHVTRKFQTLSYYGFNSEEMKNFISKHNMNGVDRIVPIGQGLSINLIWDGYDIINSFTRNIDVI